MSNLGVPKRLEIVLEDAEVKLGQPLSQFLLLWNGTDEHPS